MKQKNTIIASCLALLAAILIIAGLYRVVVVYRHYREDMLTYESRHMNSIVSSSARGMDWMMDGYAVRLAQMVGRREFTRAEEVYLAEGDPVVMRALMARPDVREPLMHYSLGVYSCEGGVLLGATDAAIPAPEGEDEVLGENVFLRQDQNGDFWFVFGEESANGFWYEICVRAETMFSLQAETARIGQQGYLFLLDRENRFLAYSRGGRTDAFATEEALTVNTDISRTVLEELAGREETTPEDYSVYRFQWPDSPGGAEETLVVTWPLNRSGSGLVLGAAVSFREFNSFLSRTLEEVTLVVLMELGGALLLFYLAARVLIANRRSAMELAAVRERADMMEEINRQQQSIAHNERLQQLGVMTSGIVHEFNNLLTPIMSQSMLLLEQLADQEDSPQFESALDIYEASENARDTLRRMSAMGKKDADMSYQPLDLGELLRRTAALAALAKDPHILQETELPDEPILVLGNDRLLTQAFLNICINACQAMGAEGTLTIAASEELRSGRRYARVEISDTGPGIAEEKIGSIYDPFFTTKGEQGTGLGLAICQKIIESHKGTITAGNRENGSGAVFTVRIPVTELPEDE